MNLTTTATLLSAALLAGCATTYHHPAIKDPKEMERKRSIAEGYCARMARGMPVPPMPQFQQQQQLPTTYTTTGQARIYNPNSGYTTATYNEVTHAQPTGGYGSVASSALSGYAQGRAMRAAMDAQKERDAVKHGCMLELGWIKE